MKTRCFFYISNCLIFLFSFIDARPVLAHGGDPRLEISTERLNPGAMLDIRGVDFAFEQQIALVLSGAQTEIPLGSATADAEGSFQLTISLPEDLSEGNYIIRATTDDHIVDSPEITIWGSANAQGGSQDRLNEDAGYGLLAPMPTPAVGVATAISQTAPSVNNTPRQNSPEPSFWFVSGIGILIVAGLVLRLRLKR